MREEVPREGAGSMLNKERGVEPPSLPIDRRTHRLDIIVVIVTQIGRLQERAQRHQLWKGIVIRPRRAVTSDFKAQKRSILA